MLESSSNHLRSYVRRICAEAASPTDELLWDRFVRSNDQNAFEVLVHRHGSMVLACAQRVLSDRSEAEDVFQATFLSLARAGRKLRQPKAMTSWLYQTAYRIALKLRAKRPPTVLPELESESTSNHESDLAWREVRGVLDEELQRLPDDLRSPLLLCYLNGLSRDEAARQLGCSFDQLKRRLEKGRDTLRSRLERRGIAGAAMALAVVSPEMLQAGVSPVLIAKILAWVRADAAVPPTVALLLASANTISKGVVMKSMVVAALCVGVGVWGFSNIGEGVEPQEKSSPPTEVPGKKPDQPNPPNPLAVKKSDDSDSLRAGSQQSRRSLNNLKQIMLAIHNFESAYGYLPSDIVDKEGKPLLSWRVLLLPYLEQTPLYQQIKLDEPWDSESNLKLLPKMPDIYRVGFEAPKTTNTFYRAFSGVGVPLTPFMIEYVEEGATGGPGIGAAGGSDEAPAVVDKKTNPKKDGPRRIGRNKFTSITDGTSNTIGVVEAGPPVPWTKPGGIPFDIKKPLPDLAGPFENVLHVGMMDGSVVALKRGLPEATLRILIGMKDGNITPAINALRQPFPPDTPEEKAELKKRINSNSEQIKEMLKLHERQLNLVEEMNKSSAGFVETDQIGADLETLMNRLKKEIQVYEAELAKRKNEAAKSKK